jgi:flagella basal body P-ring formation protein FlgA
MLRIAFAAILALSVPAAAQSTSALGPAAPALKRSVTVETEIVRIGDLIDNAGRAANVAIFRAPDLGDTGAVPASRVLQAARAHDVIGVDAGEISEVLVTRASRAITANEIQARIAKAIAGQYGVAGNLAVTLEREMRTIHVEPTATAELQIARLSYDARSGHFDAALELPGSSIARNLPLRFSGTAVETVETAMLTRALARGEIIRRADVVMERRPKSEVGNETFSAANEAVGLSTRRVMRPGQMLRQADLMKPELVQRNETVTLLFEVPGIVLTIRGKAMESGAEGDVVSVLNTQSKRTVQGTVTAMGTVTVAGMKPRIAVNTASFEVSESLDAQKSRTE